jgi:hypothetical protein
MEGQHQAITGFFRDELILYDLQAYRSGPAQMAHYRDNRRDTTDKATRYGLLRRATSLQQGVGIHKDMSGKNGDDLRGIPFLQPPYLYQQPV